MLRGVSPTPKAAENTLKGGKERERCWKVAFIKLHTKLLVYYYENFYIHLSASIVQELSLRNTQEFNFILSGPESQTHA